MHFLHLPCSSGGRLEIGWNKFWDSTPWFPPIGFQCQYTPPSNLLGSSTLPIRLPRCHRLPEYFRHKGRYCPNHRRFHKRLTLSALEPNSHFPFLGSWYEFLFQSCLWCQRVGYSPPGGGIGFRTRHLKSFASRLLWEVFDPQL